MRAWVGTIVRTSLGMNYPRLTENRFAYSIFKCCVEDMAHMYVWFTFKISFICIRFECCRRCEMFFFLSFYVSFSFQINEIVYKSVVNFMYDNHSPISQRIVWKFMVANSLRAVKSNLFLVWCQYEKKKSFSLVVFRIKIDFKCFAFWGRLFGQYTECLHTNNPNEGII